MILFVANFLISHFINLEAQLRPNINVVHEVQDEVNLKIAITARLLNKKRMLDDHLMVICRADSSETESNMASFSGSIL